MTTDWRHTACKHHLNSCSTSRAKKPGGHLTTLLRSIHEVDKNATQIWFAFYPLSLFRALQQAEDKDELAKQLLMQGHYALKDQVDSSHTFLYGHRYWPQVKKAVEAFAQNFDGNSAAQLSDQILDVARQTAASSKVEVSLLVGITAVAFMTIQQVDWQTLRRSWRNTAR